MVVTIALLVTHGVFHQDVKVDWPNQLMASPRAKAVKEPNWLTYPTYPPFD